MIKKEMHEYEDSHGVKYKEVYDKSQAQDDDNFGQKDL